MLGLEGSSSTCLTHDSWQTKPSWHSSNLYQHTNDMLTWHTTHVLTANYHSLCLMLSWRNIMSAAVSLDKRLRFDATTKPACENKMFRCCRRGLDRKILASQLSDVGVQLLVLPPPRERAAKALHCLFRDLRDLVRPRSCLSASLLRRSAPLLCACRLLRHSGPLLRACRYFS